MNARVCARSVVIALTSSYLASAQTPPLESDRSTEDEARVALAKAYELGKRGDTEGACVLFEKSARLSPSADALLNAGICREYQADLVGALSAFDAALAASSGQPKRQAAIEPRIDAVRARIPTIRLPPPAIPEVVVEVDGRRIRDFGVPLELNPGEHELRVTAPNARAHAETFYLMPSQALSLDIPELEAEAPPPTPALAPPPVAPKTPPAPPPAKNDAELAPTYRMPLVVGGVAVFALGGAFSAWQFSEMSAARSRKHDLSDEHGCNIDGTGAPASRCDASVRARIDGIYADDEEPARKRAWLGLAASGVGAATALIGYVALSPSPKGAGRLRPSLEVGPSVCTARLGVSF